MPYGIVFFCKPKITERHSIQHAVHREYNERMAWHRTAHGGGWRKRDKTEEKENRKACESVFTLGTLPHTAAPLLHYHDEIEVRKSIRISADSRQAKSLSFAARQTWWYAKCFKRTYSCTK